MADLRTPLARARGLGSAKEGAAHWWAQRLTAVALVPLTLWFAAALVALTGADHENVTAWLANPLMSVPMILLLAAGLVHANLGFRVVIEDYVHVAWQRVTLIVAVKFVFVVAGVLAVFSVLKIAFGG